MNNTSHSALKNFAIGVVPLHHEIVTGRLVLCDGSDMANRLQITHQRNRKFAVVAVTSKGKAKTVTLEFSFATDQ